jgi:cell division transport system permease protein
MSRMKHNLRAQLSINGPLDKFHYFFGKAWLNLCNNRLMTLVTVTTITLALLIISIFMLCFVNMEGTAEQWSRKVVVTIYYEKEPSPQEITSMKKKILSMNSAENVSFVSKQEALKRFRTRVKGQES